MSLRNKLFLLPLVMLSGYGACQAQGEVKSDIQEAHLVQQAKVLGSALLTASIAKAIVDMNNANAVRSYNVVLAALGVYGLVALAEYADTNQELNLADQKMEKLSKLFDTATALSIIGIILYVAKQTLTPPPFVVAPASE
jgi:hypothetical protein